MAEPAPDQTQTVLLVEDDLAIAHMYRLQLELEGYLVLTAADGETGLSIAERFQPDYIVLDIGLPGMNGLALMDTMRSTAALSEIPILILTNSDSADVEKRSLELGARHFLVKSKTSPHDLAGWVRHVNNSGLQ